MRVKYLLIVILLLQVSCKRKPRLDTPTAGNIKILVDETYRPIIDTGLEVFHSIYVLAKLEPEYMPEAEAFNLFATDSVQVIVAARSLVDSERKYLEDIKIIPKITEIAHDALAIIVHPSMGETNFSVAQLKDIMSGKIKDWSGVGKSAGKISVVFDNQSSSCARYMIDSLNGGQKLPENVYATEETEDVITYVAEHPGSIGIIGVNWVSDLDDPQSQKFVNSVTVCGISKTADSEAFQPFQAYIATKDYPLVRKMYIISRQGRNGLGTGFASFMASDRGQKIVLKSGLVPAAMPVRLVEVKDKMPE